MKKTISLALIVCMVTLLFAGCGKNQSTMNVFVIQGPTGMGMVNLMEQSDADNTKNDYNFNIVSSPDEVVAKITSKEADIAAIPTNLAATLYNKTEGNITVLAVNTYGVLYILESKEAIQSMSDLRGKTIYSTGKGSNPEYILNFLLAKNNLDPSINVTVEYVDQNEQLAEKFFADPDAIVMAPQPFAASLMAKSEFVRIAIDINEEWNNAVDDGSKLMMGCVVVRNDYLESNPDAVKQFLVEYKDSIDKTSSDRLHTAELCAEYGIVAQTGIAMSALPRSNITFCTGEEMKTGLSGYLKVLYDANPKSIGGQMPGDDFYYAEPIEASN